jgi:hypothetical protein
LFLGDSVSFITFLKFAKVCPPLSRSGAPHPPEQFVE